MQSIEAILEKNLNQQASVSDVDETEILSKIYILATNYANATGNKVILRCETPSGSKVFSYNSVPRAMTINNRENIMNSPQSTASPVKVKKFDVRKSSNPQVEFRRLVLEHVKRALRNPKLINVPLQKLSITGWPKDIPIKVSNHRLSHIQRLADLLESGKIDFKLKKH